jgi:hypothetical protein
MGESMAIKMEGIDWLATHMYADIETLENSLETLHRKYTPEFVDQVFKSGHDLIERLRWITNKIYYHNFDPDTQTHGGVDIEKEEKPIETGHVYMIRMGEYVKIGISKNPLFRIEKQISPKLPEPARIEYVSPPWEDYVMMEKELHESLQIYRSHGEWFKLTEREMHLVIDTLPIE